MSMRHLIKSLQEQVEPSQASKLALKNAPVGKSSLSESDLKAMKKEWDGALSEYESGISALVEEIAPKANKIIAAARGGLVYDLDKSALDSLGMTTKQIKQLAIDHAAAFGRYKNGLDTMRRIWGQIEGSISNISDLRKSAEDQYGYYSFKVDATAGSDVRALWSKLTGGNRKYDATEYRDAWKTFDQFAKTAFYGRSYCCGLTYGKSDKCEAGTLKKSFAKDFKEWEAELGK